MPEWDRKMKTPGSFSRGTLGEIGRVGRTLEGTGPAGMVGSGLGVVHGGRRERAGWGCEGYSDSALPGLCPLH